MFVFEERHGTFSPFQTYALKVHSGLVYPLGVAGYMEAIYAEIDAAQAEAGLKVTPQHLCTQLEGPLRAVFEQLRWAFDRAAEGTPHVVVHATLSAHSPSRTLGSK